MTLKAFTLLSTLITLALSATAHAQPAASDRSETIDLARAKETLAKIGPTFIENRGQWPRGVRYYSRTNGLDLWVTERGVTYDIYQVHAAAATSMESPVKRAINERSMPTSRSGHRIRMEFVGAKGAGLAKGVKQVPGEFNFFIGNDPSRWARNVAHFSETRLERVYDGIDARLYYEEGMPRYDMIVAPHADPSAIKIRFAGAEKITINEKGEIAIATKLGDVAQQGLYAYQTIAGRERQVPCSFTLNDDGTVGFTLGAYDRSAAVVIDPLLYSTYIGGSGDDNAYAMAVDGSGNAYLTGYASSWEALTDSFPATVGAYDKSYNGGTIDAFVTKLDCASNILTYSTFIGGSSFEDARGLVIDGSGSAYVCGYTGSSNFPTTSGAYAQNYNGGPFDGFVLKLSANGSALTYSTFIGGQYTDGAYALALGAGSTVRVCGYTASSDFPTTSGAYDQTFNGNDDIFVATLNSGGSALLSSTFIGGQGTDYAYAILVDAGGNAYVSGNTSSTDFPTTGGAFDRIYGGGAHDACVLRVGAGDGSLGYSTYLGGAGADYAYGIDLPGSGRLTVTGYSSSSDFPTTQGAYDVTYNGGAFDIFVTKFEQGLQTLRYSTFIGGSSDDYAYDIVLDDAENAFICGNTASDSIPSTPGAFDRSHNDISYDGYIAEVSSDGTSLLYATFFGGGDQDIANDIDLLGNTVYFCGTTRSRNYPVSSNAYDDTLGKKYVDGQYVYSYDAFVTKLDLRNLVLLQPSASGLICPSAPYLIKWGSFRVGNVTIQLSSDGGATFPTTLTASAPAGPGEWSWPVTSTLTPGNRYRIRIADASDPTLADTSDENLVVPPMPAITQQPAGLSVCPGDSVTITAQGSGVGLRYQWRRNGTPITGGTAASLKIREVTAADTGSYTVSVTDTCGTIITSNIARIEHAAPLVASSTISPRTVCLGDTVRLTATATGHGTIRYQWRRNGTPIPGATESNYALIVERKNQEGNYDVVITDDCPTHRATYTGAITVNQVEITLQPDDRHVNLGDSVIFVVVTPVSAVTFQWRKDGVDIPGATSPSYKIPSAAAADTGMYEVVMTSAGCKTISRAARLTIQGVSAVPGSPVVGERMLLSVIPNPATGRCVVTIAPSIPARYRPETDLGLYTILGEKVIDLGTSLAAQGYAQAELDVTGLPAGIYYCRLTIDGAKSLSRMVVVAR